MPNKSESMAVKEPLAEVFRQSVSQYSKAISIHPHLYGGELYNRASELKALDKIVGQLKIVAAEAKNKQYSHLLPLLGAIKDALNGNPKLSWWNLMTISIGQAFSDTEQDDVRNRLEREYLEEIAQTLTEIIRTYQSSNTKLLLEIRLTALDVDSRLIEIQQIPGCSAESREMLDYLSSEFSLIARELDNLSNNQRVIWNENLNALIALIKKINQLMKILGKVELSDSQAYKLFCKSDYLQNLSLKSATVIEKCRLVEFSNDMQLWNNANLEELFLLLNYFPGLVDRIPLIDVASLLIYYEYLFVNDPNPQKKAPEILSSAWLGQLIIQKESLAAKSMEKLKIAIKTKQEHSFIKNPRAYYKNRLMEENDLYTLCMIYDTQSHYTFQAKNPKQVQKDCMMRMRSLANFSQPKDLDHILKSFSQEETSIRYYLLQEIILEQFISWRKHGIF